MELYEVQQKNATIEPQKFMNFFVGYFKLKGTMENKFFVSEELTIQKPLIRSSQSSSRTFKSRKSLLFKPLDLFQ